MTRERLPGGGTVFGIGRRKTQGQLARVELNQGIGHLRQAAAHAAKGAGATVGPRVQAARGAVAPTAVMVRDKASSGVGSAIAALAPLALSVRTAQAGAAGRIVAGKKVAAARQDAMSRKAKARNLKKRRKSRGGMMTGLLAAGAIAGVAGVMAARRRREQQEWAEYDPTRSVDPISDEVDTLVVQTPTASGPATDSSTASSAAGTAGGPTGAGSSAVAGGDSASTTTPGTQPKVHADDTVPSVAEGATDVSGRPADDVSKALGKGTAKSGSRH
ncbi:hypothetical protein [Micromonospora sp. KC723]|uniref:hypothetical protein n=1 Tax=Micromonospora sp. KC723 TaxID=2530381 RepID=UPI001051E1E9|nr:hypothetical protein [Micromonospora sp. KC723]TDB78506.1 hypothetical protein E1165_00460 [Micromonospora sp. KC723]